MTEAVATSSTWPWPTERAEQIVGYTKNFLQLLYRTRLLRVDVEGKENIPPAGKTVVYFATHHSMIDALLVGATLKEIPGFMAMREVGEWPVIGDLARDFGTVLVDRQDKGSRGNAVTQAVQAVRAGRSVIVFAPGHCVPKGKDAVYREGCAKIAFETGVPVVPVILYGTEDVFELVTNIVNRPSKFALIRKIHANKRVKKIRTVWWTLRILDRIHPHNQMAIHIGGEFSPEDYGTSAEMTVAMGKYADAVRQRLILKHAPGRHRLFRLFR